MFVTKKKAAALAEQSKLYQSCADRYTAPLKPYEEGLKAIFTKPATHAANSAAKNEPLQRSQFKDADEIIALFDEIKKLDAFIVRGPAGKPDYWPLEAAVPSPAEQLAIAQRAQHYAQSDIERKGLEGLLTTQKQYLQRDSYLTVGGSGMGTGVYEVPASYVNESTVAQLLADNEGKRHADRMKQQKEDASFIGFFTVVLLASLAAIYCLQPEEKPRPGTGGEKAPVETVKPEPRKITIPGWKWM